VHGCRRSGWQACRGLCYHTAVLGSSLSHLEAHDLLCGRQAAEHADRVPCACQGAAATAELTALVHGAAGLLRLLLTPDAPPAASTQRSIDRSAAALPVYVEVLLRHLGQAASKGWSLRDHFISVATWPCTLIRGATPDDLMLLLRSWHRVVAEARKRPQGAFPRDLLQAAAAVSNALQSACGKPGGDGAAAAGQLDARAAADAVAAALLQVCSLARRATFRGSMFSAGM
jgi:hypothetical protein